jgi:hypothetical protein
MNKELEAILHFFLHLMETTTPMLVSDFQLKGAKDPYLLLKNSHKKHMSKKLKKKWSCNSCSPFNLLKKL